jgi:HlyB family type I secretion system ABC transporter
MNISPLLQVQGEHYSDAIALSPTPLAAILQLLKAAAGDTNHAGDFSQVWKIRSFELGDELQNTKSSDILSLVCQGRVRLLGYDTCCGREVSTQLLLPGETFGGDKLFFPSTFDYRAIAASPVRIAFVEIPDLQVWLQQIPTLQSYLQQAVQTRQGLIFFKTMTELRSSSSYTLQKILPHLMKMAIKAGESLQEINPASQGRFWLMDGCVCTASTEAPSPQIGESWGYPDATPDAWSAETDLVVYQLPAEYWESTKSLVLPSPHLTNSRDLEERANNRHHPSPIEEKANNRHHPSTIEERANNRHHPSTIEERVNNLHHPSHIQERANNPHNPSPIEERANNRFLLPNGSYPFIRQQSSDDCGVACLAMVCMYWDKRISLNRLRNLARTNRMGTTLPGLVDAAKHLGYETEGVKASLNSLELQNNPWIAHWQGIHYVVVWKINSDRNQQETKHLTMTISDPALGKRTITHDEFVANWTGYALLLTPTERLRKIESEKISLTRIWQILWHYRNLLAQITLASVVLQIFGLIIPVIAWIVIDRVLTVPTPLTVNLFAFGFLLFGAWRLLVRAVRQYLLDYLSNHLDMNLVGNFIRHTLELPLQFFASRQVGDIITRVEENRKIQSFLTRRAVVISLDALMALACFGLIAYYNLQLALLAMGLTIPVACFSLSTNPTRERVSRDIAQQTAVQNTAVVEMMAGITTIKASAAEQWMRSHWEERFANAIKARFQGQRLANNLQLASSTIAHLGTTVLLWCAATLVMEEQLTIGQFVAFNMLVSSISQPVLALFELRSQYQEVLVSMERLNDVLEAEPETNPSLTLEILPKIRGEVHFENVTFSYHPEESDALQNLSFRIQPGQTIGIVGASGSGKTTLVNLLAGLYRPNSGRILIDGRDISEVTPQSLRSQLGIVPQESFMFSGTILENITLFNSELSLEDAIASAKLAAVHKFIHSLPLGYHTQIGEKAKILSGGQRQGIVLARALIRNPPILVLDQATNSLDRETENQVQQNLSHLRREQTTFIVTHKLNLLQHCDRILVLNRGIVVEKGTHQDLISNNKLYSHLIQQYTQK